MNYYTFVYINFNKIPFLALISSKLLSRFISLAIFQDFMTA